MAAPLTLEQAPLSPTEGVQDHGSNNNNQNEGTSVSISYQAAGSLLSDHRNDHLAVDSLKTIGGDQGDESGGATHSSDQLYDNLVDKKKDSGEEPYSPALTYPTPPEAMQEGGNTSMKLTVLLLVNNVIGGGILSLPTCLHQTSIVVGVLLLLLTTATTILNLVFIVDSAQAANEYRYGVLITNNFGKVFANLMFISLIIWPLGTCVAYAQIVSEAMPPVLKSFGVASDNFAVSPTCWLLIGGIIFFSISCRRHLSDLLIPSIAGLVAIGVSGIAIMVRCFDGSYSPGGKYYYGNMTLFDEGDIDTSYEVAYVKPTLFMALPVFAFALNVHSNMPHYYLNLRLKNGKRSPRKMFKAIGYSHLLITVLYIVFGVFGVVTFHNNAEHIKAAKGDVLNMYSDEDMLMNVIRVFYFVVILVSFPILHMATRKGFNQFVFGTKELPFWTLAIETFCIILFSCVVAAFVPSLNETLAILGSVVGVVVMFVGPSLLYLKLCVWDENHHKLEGDDFRYAPWKKYGAYFSIGFGVVVPGILGLVTTFVDV